MVRMTTEGCARCTNRLASSNASKDRLCGDCQRELGPKASAAYRAWITEGRKREIDRTAEGTAALALEAARTEDLISELERRRKEAEELLRVLSSVSVLSTSKASG